MKKKTPKNAYLSVKDAELLERIIEAAKERWTIKDIVFYFTNDMGWQEKSEVVKAIFADETMKDEVCGLAKDEMRDDGFTVLKMETMDKQDKLQEFLDSIFPYYNEQQRCILF